MKRRISSMFLVAVMLAGMFTVAIPSKSWLKKNRTNHRLKIMVGE